MHQLLKIAPEVTNALRDQDGVVALESTVIAHGLPRPLNMQTALRMQEVVREEKAVPATIGILNGDLRVGLTDDQIGILANTTDVWKVSTRDLPFVVAEHQNGGTTVASSIWIAHRAGIKVFATGGIGGIHRGSLPDVSADLPELARTPIIVVCSGAKIVLDLPATREWLETHGVTVIGYRCHELPAFYSQKSGLRVDFTAESREDVVRIFHAQQMLGLKSALLVVVPVPTEFEVPAEELDEVLNFALKEADRRGFTGYSLTPFLLEKMAERSGGATLRANIALLENNARVAAAIARAVG
jgi:pseudouridine-5'-phosphate glycosidase